MKQNNAMNYNPMMENSDNNMMKNNMKVMQPIERCQNQGMNMNLDMMGSAMNQGIIQQQMNHKMNLGMVMAMMPSFP